MTILLAAVLAGLAATALVGLPRSGSARLAALGPRRVGWSPLSPLSWTRHGVTVGPAVLRHPPPPAAAALIGGAAAAAGGPAFGVLALVISVAGARALARRARAADQRDERARAVEACLAVAAELGAGRTPAEALQAAAELAVGPSRTALVHAARAATLGGDVPAALTSVDGSAVPELLRALGACWRVCASAGSGLAPAVERLADGLGADADRRRAVEAELAGPRATGGLLALLPLAGVLLAAGLGADPWDVLFHTPLGAACLLLGVGLELLGLWWTTRLVDRALLA